MDLKFFVICLLLVPQLTYSQKDPAQPDNFRSLSCGLFINNKGDISFKSSCLIDDMGNRSTCYQTWGYNVDDLDTTESYIVELKNIVDTSSFQILNDYYCKDRNYVYVIFYTSSGATLNITKKIDIKTFKAISNCSYGFDKKHVYFRANKIKANRKTFNCIAEDPFGAYDNVNYYYYGEVITDKEANEKGYKK